MDSVAYDSKEVPYIVSNDVMDSEGVNIIVSNLKKERLTDPQIRKRLSEIEAIVMDNLIALNHPRPEIRAIAQNQMLSKEDKQTIYEMTQGDYEIGGTGGLSVIPVDDFAQLEVVPDDSDSKEEALANLLVRYGGWGNNNHAQA